MRVRVCDKCGKQIRIDSTSPVSYPFYSIVAHHAMYNTREIDLCDDCSKKFAEWLSDKED